MAVSVVKYPQGHPARPATVTTATVSDSSGDALFTAVGHGLTDGRFIYIYSNIERYNGYWYVDQISVDTFKIKDYATSSFVAYVASGSVSFFYSAVAGTNNPWNCVHLPMVYTFKSDTWPINGVDTSRTITTFTNWNGYTYLVLNGDIKSTGTASTLENVILSGVTGVGGADITGVYRIVQWFSDTNIVIDLAYDAGNVLSAGTCQYYYLHYHAKVKIYAGLDSGHYWAAQKPYELITTERVVFDSSGIGTLNVADFVKSKIEVFSNDLQENTLPNNLNSWCRVYISIAESYDDSDGYLIEEYTSSYTDDTTEVYAVNAKLLFKTRSSGALDEYVWVGLSDIPQKFLTPFVQPTLFAGYYFDVSFIHNLTSAPIVKVDRYNNVSGNYVLASSAQNTLSDMDQGVYRYQVEQTGSEDRIDLTLYDGSTIMSETMTIDVVDDCDQFRTTNLYLTWKNYLGGQDYWLFTAQKLFSVDILESKTNEINIHNQWPKSYGEFADSITRQSSRKSKNMVRISSQYLTKEQMDGIAWIVSSPLVQILTTTDEVTTARTVIVDTSTLKKYQDRDNLYSISFNVSYTDELPTQTA